MEDEDELRIIDGWVMGYNPVTESPCMVDMNKCEVITECEGCIVFDDDPDFSLVGSLEQLFQLLLFT